MPTDTLIDVFDDWMRKLQRCFDISGEYVEEGLFFFIYVFPRITHSGDVTVWVEHPVSNELRVAQNSDVKLHNQAECPKPSSWRCWDDGCIDESTIHLNGCPLSPVMSPVAFNACRSTHKGLTHRKLIQIIRLWSHW
jgi:hypothetical protein